MNIENETAVEYTTATMEESVISENCEMTLAPTTEALVGATGMSMEKALEMSNLLSKSTIVPVAYQHRPENCYIALELANRMNVPIMMIMQNLHIIQGKPSFSGSACASIVKNHPKFKDVELVYVGTEGKDDWGAYVTAKNAKNGKEVKGSTVTLGIAKKEGWYGKSGSKWQSMPELMLAYRAYSWFCRVHCPEVLMGMQTSEEVEDVVYVEDMPKAENPYNK